MSTMLANIFIGAIVTGMFTLVAYLLKRVVDQNDVFQTNTRTSLSDLRSKFITQQSSIQTLARRLEEIGIDPSTKAKMSALTLSLQGIQKDLTEIKPTMEKAEENHGTVIWIKKELKAQDAKLVGLYQILKKLTGTP